MDTHGGLLYLLTRTIFIQQTLQDKTYTGQQNISPWPTGQVNRNFNEVGPGLASLTWYYFHSPATLIYNQM